MDYGRTFETKKMIGMIAISWVLVETIGITHCMQIIYLVDVASLQPSVTWIKGSLSNPKLVIPSIFFGLGHSTTELLDCIITLQVIVGKLPVCFLVFCQLGAHPAHWEERNVNQVIAAWAGLFVPLGFVFCCSLLPKISRLQCIFLPQPSCECPDFFSWVL